MKYQSPQLRTSLAAEYALGTLRGRARARFDKLIGADRGLQEEVTFWNERLSDLALTLPPQAPRAVVWTALEQELARDAAQIARKVVPLRPKAVSAAKLAPAAANSPLWKLASLAASVAAVALGVGLSQARSKNSDLVAQLSAAQTAAEHATQEVAQLTEQQATQAQAVAARFAALKSEPLPYVAVFAPADGGTDMRWAVSLHPSKNVMRVVLTGSKPMPMTPGAKSLQLWMIAKDGPHPLGMLPLSGQGAPMEMSLPAMPADELGTALTLAVSEEPEGGSPTGKPTGKVLGAFPAARAI